MEIQSILSEFATKCGLSLHEFRILKYIDQHQNTNLSELSKNILCNDSQSSIWVNDLTKKGLVDRIRDEGDRRRLYLRLTKTGRDKLLEMDGDNSELHCFMDDALNLSVEEIEFIIGLNGRILNGLQARRRIGE